MLRIIREDLGNLYKTRLSEIDLMRVYSGEISTLDYENLVRGKDLKGYEIIFMRQRYDYYLWTLN